MCSYIVHIYLFYYFEPTLNVAVFIVVNNTSHSFSVLYVTSLYKRSHYVVCFNSCYFYIKYYTNIQ